MEISVQIDRLVLEGIDVPYGQQPLLQQAFETELARLLAAGGPVPGLLSGGAVPSMPAEGIPLESENSATRLGVQIARSVYGGLGG